MDSPIEADVSVFMTCGVKIPLGSIGLPDQITLTHDVPEEFKDLANERCDKSKCDIAIVIADKTLHAHKALLSFRIPFFQALFNSNMVECTNGEINLSSQLCEISTFENLLEYAYKGCLTISETNVQEMMMGANFFQMESVKDECGRFMTNRVRIDNLLSIFAFFKSIAYHANDDRNIVPISFTIDFLNLPIDELIVFLQRDSLNVDEENQVFEIINRWISKDIYKTQYAARLLRRVRLPLLTEGFISETIEKAEWVRCNPDCMVTINAAKMNLRNFNMRFESSKATKRVCEQAQRLIFSFRDNLSPENDHTITMEPYNPVTNAWTQGPTGKVNHHLEPLAVIDNKIYFLGGRRLKG